MKVGIIGLEFVGKKSLFSLLTGTEYTPGVPDKKEINTVNVPDERIDFLADFYKSKKVVYSQIEFNLIPSIKKESDETKKALVEAREVDMFAVVIRQFTNENVFHPFKSIDFKRDFNTIMDEMVLADLVLIETRLERIEKQIRTNKRDELLKEKDLLLRIKEPLENGKLLSDTDLNQEEMRLIRGFQLLTLKPIFVIINCDESKLNEKFDISGQIQAINISVSIESEIQQLTDEAEKKEFLESIGLKESSLDRLIKFSYNFGNLISFITAAEKEAHSWTIVKGTNAQQAAGTIHTDFEKGFIRAEVIHFNDFKNAGSEAEAKKQGLYLLEGKEYIVQDGDIIVFRFNV